LGALEPNPKVRVSKSTVYTELDDEMVLLNLATEMYFGLDAIGTQIWKLIEQGASPGAMFEQLLANYDVDPAELRADLSAFLDLLAEKGLTLEVDG
jgi:hypothetical protein